MRVVLPIVLLALCALAACRNTPHDEGFIIPIYELRETVPDDSVTVSAPFTYQIHFKRTAVLSELNFRIIPEPQSVGAIETSPSNQFVFIRDIVPSDRTLAHQLLITGPRVTPPIVQRFYSGDAHGTATCQGELCCSFGGGSQGFVGELFGSVLSRDSRVSGANAAVFAVLAADVIDALSPRSLFDAPPMSVVLADFPAFNDEFRFHFTNLVRHESYAFFCIVDTSGDGLYDPEDDWWGYFAQQSTGNILFQEVTTGFCVFQSADMELLPPGSERYQ